MNQHYVAVLSFVVFSMLAFVSSTHDILADALYLTALDDRTQKIYVGIRSIFYQIGLLFVNGGLLIVLPPLALYYQINVWSLFFLSLFGLIFLLALYHAYQLPHPHTMRHHRVPIKHLIQHLYAFSKNHFFALLFVFFYNISIAPMQKIIPIFLLDHQGMNLSLSQVGTIYGLWGTGFFMFGIFISGYVINYHSVSLSIKRFTLFLTVTNALFIGVVFFFI
jgi:PAT family beta-lactamase induction signal transducer AmpG